MVKDPDQNCFLLPGKHQVCIIPLTSFAVNWREWRSLFLLFVVEALWCLHLTHNITRLNKTFFVFCFFSYMNRNCKMCLWIHLSLLFINWFFYPGVLENLPGLGGTRNSIDSRSPPNPQTHQQDNTDSTTGMIPNSKDDEDDLGNCSFQLMLSLSLFVTGKWESYYLNVIYLDSFFFFSHFIIISLCRFEPGYLLTCFNYYH